MDPHHFQEPVILEKLLRVVIEKTFATVVINGLFEIRQADGT